MGFVGVIEIDMVSNVVVEGVCIGIKDNDMENMAIFISEVNSFTYTIKIKNTFQ